MRFPGTSWLLVEEAGGQVPPRITSDALAALDRLLLRYLPALRAHLIRRWRLEPEQAEDFLQGFILQHVLEKRLIGKANRARGKFRTFLLTALDHFVSNALRAQRAARRGGGQVRSLDHEQAMEPAAPGSLPHHALDSQWARQVLEQAIDRMRQHCLAGGRGELWELFDLRVLKPAIEGTAPPPYQHLVQRFGFQTPAQASNALVTAKRTFARVLRQVVAEYVADEKQIDSEIADLQAILARSR
ncbi:hypothetical protein [Fontivita pretiosa]|uniref:hypothetical protein n=1 Tax=Fontivita pretiosa TaxID=2989684 RepID=UPI003D16C5D4